MPSSRYTVLSTLFVGSVDFPGRANADADSRRVQGRLRVHAEGKHVEQHLHVALRLHRAAHDAEDAVSFRPLHW